MRMENKIKECIFQDTEKVVAHKLSNVSSQSSVQVIVSDFVDSEKSEIFVLLANMQNTSCKIVNHIRMMIEEAEPQQQEKTKLFIVLLHFAPTQFSNHCYPTLFLKEWDHYYLDTVANTTPKGAIQISDWLQEFFFDAEDSTLDQSDHLVCTANGLLLQVVPVLSAHMNFGNKTDQSFNSVMSATQRERALTKLLDECKLGLVLCEKFSEYWKPRVMLEYLERAADINKHRDSVLNITDSVQSKFEALFFDFCLYMLTHANKNYNLDLLFGKEPSASESILFRNIFKCLPVPKLNQLCLLCMHLPLPEPPRQRLQFPFFNIIYNKMEKLVETSSESINLKMDLLEENDPSFSNSEQRLQKLTDDVSSTIKKSVEVSFPTL